MYMGIALASLGKRASEKTGDSVAKTQAPNSVTEVMKRGREKLLAAQAEEKLEKAAKKAAKAAKKVKKIEAKAASLQDFLAKTSAKKFEGGFRAGTVNHIANDTDIAAIAKTAALRGLTGNESEEEATAKMVANMKEFIRSNLQAALAEHINGKVASGKVLSDNSNYVKELGKSWRKVSEAFIRGSGEDLLKLFGSQEELASFMASMEAELHLEDREITQVVDVQVIDPVQSAAPSIRANDQVHEVPASMEGLQADVARLNEKFGK